MFVLKQRVEELGAAAEEAETLRLDLMEARREAQELQHRQQRWQEVLPGQEAAGERGRRQQEAEEWQRGQAREQQRRQERERWEREQAEEEAAAAARRQWQRQRAEDDHRRMLVQQQQQQQERQQQQQQELRQAQLLRQQEREARQLAELQRRETAMAAQLPAPAYPSYPYDRAFRPTIERELERQEAFYYGQRHGLQQPASGTARPRSAARAAAAAVAGTLPQHASREREQPPHSGAASTAGSAPGSRHRQLPGQYATIGVPAAHATPMPPARTAHGHEGETRLPRPQQHAQRRAATLLDARAFTPLGAGAAGLLRGEQQQQRQARRDVRHDGDGHDPRQYHTMF